MAGQVEDQPKLRAEASTNDRIAVEEGRFDARRDGRDECASDRRAARYACPKKWGVSGENSLQRCRQIHLCERTIQFKAELPCSAHLLCQLGPAQRETQEVSLRVVHAWLAHSLSTGRLHASLSARL